MRSFGRVTSWAAGAVGRPGERTFFVQFSAADGLHGFVVEKTQIAALVLEGRRLLASAGVDTTPPHSGPGVVAEVVPEFRVGEIHLAYREVAEEVTIGLIPTSDEVDGVEFTLTLEQFGAELIAAQDAVEGGRPLCPRCGLAMDLDGHHCPSTNGDLRGHRP